MQRISDLEKSYVLDVLNSEFHSSAGGKMTERLEKKFAEVFQSKYAISFVNGTATMHAALAAADVGKGDEVIVPPLTMASTSFAVLHAGALPVFADINPDTWTLDPEAIEKCITQRTKAIIPVSIYGLAPNMHAIMKIADEYNLFVLEDDAQCFMGYCGERIMGSIGHAASFSFQSSKHITSGEGGMIVTSNYMLANKIRKLNSLGYAGVDGGAGKGKITKEMIQDPKYERHESIGWNYRMPELCAAVALGQLERIKELVDMRISVANLYKEAIEGSDLVKPQMVPEGFYHSYWTYAIRLKNKSGINWYDFRNKYRELGGDGIYAAWQLTYLEPAFKGKKFAKDQTQYFGRGLCPVAESIQPHLLQLRTNYYDLDSAKEKAKILKDTIRYFSSLTLTK